MFGGKKQSYLYYGEKGWGGVGEGIERARRAERLEVLRSVLKVWEPYCARILFYFILFCGKGC